MAVMTAERAGSRQQSPVCSHYGLRGLVVESAFGLLLRLWKRTTVPLSESVIERVVFLQCPCFFASVKCFFFFLFINLMCSASKL